MPLTPEQRRAALTRAAKAALSDCAVVLVTDKMVSQLQKASSEVGRVKGRMKRASYRHAVDFIALNDNPADGADVNEIDGYATTMLVSDIFDVPVERVAKDVARVRIAEDAAEERRNRLSADMERDEQDRAK